jgi:hypothetical protein
LQHKFKKIILPNNTLFFVVALFCSYIHHMKIKERDWIVGEHKVGTQFFYSEVEPELIATEPGVRVLPAAYFYEKGVRCELIKRHEPGEYRLMPNGGFEVMVEGGGRRYFELDQVIVHPAVVKQQKLLDKMRQRSTDDKQPKSEPQPKEPSSGRRGRPGLSPEERARREAEKTTRAEKSGGKRGRPKSGVLTPKTPKAPTGGKRGRRPLDPAIREARAHEAVARAQRSGGKRGRPKRN